MPIRMLLAKPGLDGHEAGVRLVARVLRDAGMEVIYLGMRQTPASIAAAAVQEGVAAVGLSVLSGIHKEAARDVLAELRDRGAGHIPVFVGGIIPPRDTAELTEMGVAAVFGPGSHTGTLAKTIRDIVERQVAGDLWGPAGGRG